MKEGIHPAIMGLIQALPEVGAEWPAKGEWLKAIAATINVVYPLPLDDDLCRSCFGSGQNGNGGPCSACNPDA